MSCTRDAVERIKELQNHIKEYRDQVAELQIELERERERSDVQVIYNFHQPNRPAQSDDTLSLFPEREREREKQMKKIAS